MGGGGAWAMGRHGDAGTSAFFSLFVLTRDPEHETRDIIRIRIVEI
jgi:hypothetical protein